MSCAHPQENVSLLLDERLAGEEKENALAHLKSCTTCNRRFQYAHNLRQSLREMNQAPLPEGLSDRLRVLASHERERRLIRSNFAAHLASRIRLSFDNLMRPMALPIVGGLLSAMLLLGAWAPTMAGHRSSNDVPLPLWVYADPSPRSLQTVTNSGDVVVELTIDARGRVVDYSVRSGEMTPALGNMILLSRFNPALVFGRPTQGKLIFRVSQISVIG